MALNVPREVAALQRMTVKHLRQRYEEVFDEACWSNHKQWLVKRIAWRLQANEEGDLSERARRRAAELANDADLRMKAPRREEVVARARRSEGESTDHHGTRQPHPHARHSADPCGLRHRLPNFQSSARSHNPARSGLRST